MIENPLPVLGVVIDDVTRGQLTEALMQSVEWSFYSWLSWIMVNTYATAGCSNTYRQGVDLFAFLRGGFEDKEGSIVHFTETAKLL